MNTYVVSWSLFGFVTGAVLANASRLRMSNRPRSAPLCATAGLATAVLFGLQIALSPPLGELLAFSVLAASGVQLAVFDLVEQRLPTTLVWSTFAALVAVGGASAANTEQYGNLTRATAGSATLLCLYLAMAVASRGGLGAGDVRLAAPVGWMLAWHGWTTLAVGTILGLLGSAAAGAVIAARHRDRRAMIPHAPGMLTGAFAALLI